MSQNQNQLLFFVQFSREKLKLLALNKATHFGLLLKHIKSPLRHLFCVNDGLWLILANCGIVSHLPVAVPRWIHQFYQNSKVKQRQASTLIVWDSLWELLVVPLWTSIFLLLRDQWSVWNPVTQYGWNKVPRSKANISIKVKKILIKTRLA